MRRRALIPLLALAAIAAAVVLAACGKQGVEVQAADSGQGSAVHRGAELFAARCSGCHTLKAAGTEGSSTNVRDKERTDGPNFNQRREAPQAVLYAIRNGGFSGAIMPQNIVVGSDAQAVAAFVSKYSGKDAKSPPGPNPTTTVQGGATPGTKTTP